MNNLTEFELTAATETALKKLTKAEIPVYKLKKKGARLRFSTNSEYTKKVFAIFAHPCYNVVVKKDSPKNRLKGFFGRRFGLVAGAALFVAAAIISGNSVLKIKVTGSGSYLSPQVLSIAYECGAKEYSLCKGLDKPLLQAKVLALPGVNFCSVQRQGAYLVIDVQAENENFATTEYKPLVSSVSGVVEEVVAICGTPEKAAGDNVMAGDTLIGAYALDEEGQSSKCLAVGFARIASTVTLTVFFDCESEDNARNALSSASLYSDEIVKRSYKVKPCDGGVNYEVTFTYIKTESINIQ